MVFGRMPVKGAARVGNSRQQGIVFAPTSESIISIREYGEDFFVQNLVRRNSYICIYKIKIP